LPGPPKAAYRLGVHDPSSSRPRPNSDAGFVPITTEPTTDLTIEKVPGVVDGTLVPWTITVTNIAPDSSDGTFTVVDVVEAVLEVGAVEGGAGYLCSSSDRSVSCLYDGELADGASVDLVGYTNYIGSAGSGEQVSVNNEATVMSNGGTQSDTSDDNNLSGGIAIVGGMNR